MTNHKLRKLDFGRKLRMVMAGPVTVAGAIVIAIVSAPQGGAQQQAASAARTFEVASVKQNKAGGDRNSMVNGPAGINYSNVTLKACIRAAYGVQDYQISGPAWLTSERYDIVAKPAVHSTDEQLLLMLQTLLADRFKLKIHRESKELPVYLLIVGKNGPKLHESEGDAQPRRRLSNGSLIFQNSPISMLTEYLPRLSVISRPVLDMTGLKGNFDFTLNLVDGGQELKGEADMKLELEQGIFRIVQEQLGLKLEPTKRVVELIVVDQAEKVPTEN
jgi:uncharacterized protein (TIGR03435 family)